MGEMAARGRAGAGGRSTSMADVADEVGNIGFLGILTAGSGYIPAEYISGITNYGDAQNERLGSVLASLDGLSVGRGGGGGGWGEGAEFFDPTAYRGPTGSRREARALSVDELLNTVQPRGRVDFKGVQRTEASYEDLSIDLPTRPPVPVTDEEKERLRRKPEFVQTIINKHRLAITDCYKRLLRGNPNLKGKVEVRFAIDPDGRVSWVEIVDTTIDDESLRNCMMSRIRNWNDFGYGDPTAPDEIYRQVFTFGY
jgi:hypothetical protein